MQKDYISCHTEQNKNITIHVELKTKRVANSKPKQEEKHKLSQITKSYDTKRVLYFNVSSVLTFKLPLLFLKLELNGKYLL